MSWTSTTSAGTSLTPARCTSAERLMETIENVKPYSESTTVRTHNQQDAIFQQAGGSTAIAKTTR